MGLPSLALLLVAVLLGVSNACETALQGVDLDAKCFDGSNSRFFVSRGTSNNFVIVLSGSTSLCADAGSCAAACNPEVQCAGLEVEANSTSTTAFVSDVEEGDNVLNQERLSCFESQMYCSSTMWRSSVQANTILCNTENDLLNADTKVYLPACAMDWFLSSGTVAGQGSVALVGMFDKLISDYGLAGAGRVVVVAQGGAGVGFLNHLKQLKLKLPGVNVLTVLDSSWNVDFRSFRTFFTGPDASAEVSRADQNHITSEFISLGWIDDATLDPTCKAFWGDDRASQCLFADVLLQDALAGERVFMIQSQYDFAELRDLEFLKSVVDAKEADIDVSDVNTRDSIVSVAINSFVESYGVRNRHSMQQTMEHSALRATEVANFRNYTVFSTACAQHKYLVGSDMEILSDLQVPISDNLRLIVSRLTSLWSTVKVGDTTLQNALYTWIKGDGESNSVLVDQCGTFLCNAACPSTIESFVIDSTGPGAKTDECERIGIVTYVYLMIAVAFVAFGSACSRLFWWRSKCRSYWRKSRVFDTMNSRGISSKLDIQEQLLHEVASDQSRQIYLMVRDLSYWVAPKDTKKDKVQILDGVNIGFSPGKVHALMGPSGSGKSTLLDLLALSRDVGELSGRHYINGVPSNIGRASFLRTWLWNNLSYVRQQDVLFPQLTVLQHLEHAAWLMLPEYMPSEAKLKRVWHVLKLLELQACAHTVCGDGGVTIQGGISGGQRRRVSVATQLLRMPAALLLDEPTSGLDSTNALLLIKSLHTLAEKGRVNVIMTLHQPRREIFDYLGSLTILNKGKIVYTGPPNNAATSHFGIPDDEHNVADEILDRLAEMDDDHVKQLIARYEAGPLGQTMTQEMDAEQTYLTAAMAKDLQGVLMNNALAEGRWSWNESCSVPTMIWVLMSRTFFRGGFDLLRTIPLSLVGGVVVGLVFLGNMTYSGHTALLYLGVATMTFLQSTFLGDRYVAEKAMYSHEKDNGTKVSMWALLISQFIRNAVTSILEGVSFAVPIYFMGNLRDGSFELYLLIMIMTSFVCVAQNTCVEIHMVRKGDAGIRESQLVNMALMSLNALFNGFIVRLNDIPVYFRWISYAMLSFWSFAGLMVNEFVNFEFPCENGSVLDCSVRNGNYRVRSFGYEFLDAYISLFALMVFVLVLHIVAVMSFFFRNEYGRRGKLRVNKSAERKRKDKNKRQPDQPNGTGATMQNVLSNTSLFVPENGTLADTLTAPQIQNSPATAGKNEGTKLKHHRYGKAITSILSRQALLLFYLLDVVTAFYVCAFASVDVTGMEVSFESATNVELDVSGAGIIFVLGNLVMLGLYGFQYLVQFVFLIPRAMNGKRLGTVWISWHDVVCLVLLVGDTAITILLLSNAEASLQWQLMMVLVIRVLRFFRVLAYWGKVSTFHRVRARVYQKMRQMGSVSEDAMEKDSHHHANTPFFGLDNQEQPESGDNMSIKLTHDTSRGKQAPGIKDMFLQQGIRTSTTKWKNFEYHQNAGEVYRYDSDNGNFGYGNQSELFRDIDDEI